MAKGFESLLKLVMKDRPEKPKTVDELWSKFLRIVFMGGKRSEPEINFIIAVLGPKLGLDYVKSTDGDDWREAVEGIMKDRMLRIKDEEILVMLREFQKDLFRITASLKGSARWFKKNEITPEKLNEMLSTKEKTWQFIEDLASNEDVSNIKYTKIIIWLHSIGYADDFVPPSFQTKKFVNDEYGYYQFYDDDKYFMKKAEEFSEGIKKKLKGVKTRDVASAIFYYITIKSMLPKRSKEKKAFSPDTLVKFMKKRKMTVRQLSEKLTTFEGRDELAEKLAEFLI